MTELLAPVAAWLHRILPDWIVLPDLTFEMPHSGYWLGLILFPLIAMYLVKRSGRVHRPRVSISIAYMLWLFGGLAGLHRFYLRSFLVGIVYVLLFVLVLVGNGLSTDARNVRSDFDNRLKIAEFNVTRAQRDVDRGNAAATDALAAATAERDQVKEQADAARLDLLRWRSFVGGTFLVIVILLLVDAVLIPVLVRRREALEHDIPLFDEVEIIERGAKADERAAISTPVIRLIERVSGWSGEFVAYWSVIAVFAYYYEVIARYVFNSPTNWVHESMFLMFGMQYLLSGGFALREDAHVRVDVIYERFSVRTRAMIDIATSVIFFIFTITLVVTAFVFARDAVGVGEVSFTEWAIEYWPVKITMVVGGLLLVLQGIAKLMRDVIYVTNQRPV